MSRPAGSTPRRRTRSLTMDVREYVSVLLRQRRLVVAVMAVTLAAALAFLALRPSPWTAEATIAVEPGTAVVGGDVRQDDISYLDRLVNTYATLGASRDVTAGVAHRVGLPHAPDVQVTPIPSTNLMTVKATTPDARTATRAADAVAAELIEQVRTSSADAVEACGELLFIAAGAALEADIAQASVQLDSSRGSGDRTAERQLRERIESDRASLDAQRQTYESYQAGREARAGLDLARWTPAVRATKASRGVGQVIAVALLLGGIAAAGLAFVAENLSGSFRTRAELEASVDSLVLAAIPRVSGASRTPPSTAVRRPRRRSGGCGPTSSSRCARTCRPCWSPAPIRARARRRSSRTWAGAWRSPDARSSSSTRISARHGSRVLRRAGCAGLGDVLSASPDCADAERGSRLDGKAAEAGSLLDASRTHSSRAASCAARTWPATVGHASNGGTFTRALKLGVATGVLMTTGRGTYELADDASPGSVGIDELGRPPTPGIAGLAPAPAGRSDRRSRQTLLGSRAAGATAQASARRSTSAPSAHRPSGRARRLAIRYSVDDVLLVAGADAERDALRLTHDELARAGAPPMGIVLNSASDRGLYPYVAYPSRHRDGDLSRDDEAGLPRRRASSDAATLNSRGAQEMYQPRLSVVSHQTPVAVLGCGDWGMNYVRVFGEGPGTRVPAVCDKRAGRLQEVGRRRFPDVILTTEVEHALDTTALTQRHLHPGETHSQSRVLPSSPASTSWWRSRSRPTTPRCRRAHRARGKGWAGAA